MSRNAALATVLTALLAAACGGSSSDTPPPPPTFTGTNILPNSDLSGDNTDVWVFYDNATGGNGTSAVQDCSADGFTGNCLVFSADSYYSAQIYDSAVVLDDGAVAGETNLHLTLDTSKRYQVSFKARASKTFKVNLILQTPSYVPIKAQEFTIGTTAATYTTDVFQSGQTTATFSLQTGYADNAGASVELDDIQLLEGN
jgi:hypothetical protein